MSNSTCLGGEWGTQCYTGQSPSCDYVTNNCNQTVISVKGSQIIIELEVSVVADGGAGAGAIFVRTNNVVTQAKDEF